MKYFKMFGKDFEAYIPVEQITSFGITKNKMWVIIEDKSFETGVKAKEQLKSLMKEINIINGDHRVVGITTEK